MFTDLSHLLPLSPDLVAHLDKPSVLRLTISYMHTSALLTGRLHQGMDRQNTTILQNKAILISSVVSTAFQRIVACALCLICIVFVLIHQQ